MSHWLDDAARGLSEGTFTRRAVMRRSGTVAGGALLASVTGPVITLTRATAATRTAVPCPNVPCLPTDVCCGGNECCNSNTHFCCETLCLQDGGRVGCCHNRPYDRILFNCCPQAGPEGHRCRKTKTCCGKSDCCKKGQTCCGEKCCDNATHFCCGEFCLTRGLNHACCNGQTYNPTFEKCCPHSGPTGRIHFCPKNENCCGTSECCKQGEECCNSGNLGYCAPKGRCCPKGQHRVTCGTGKHLCCPEDEYCCGGKCCKTSDCHNGVCSKGSCGGRQCPPGQACCNPAMESCVTPFPAGPFCIGDCDGKPGVQVSCCPNGGTDACGKVIGESHPACRGGKAGCVCSRGAFCPQSGCCDITGDCLDPCFPVARDRSR